MYVYWTTCFQHGLVDHSLRYECVCILNDVFPAWTRWSFITLRVCVYIERRVSSMDSLIIHYVTIVNILWVMRVLFSLNTTLTQIGYCEIVLDRNRKHTVVKKDSLNGSIILKVHSTQPWTPVHIDQHMVMISNSL